MFFYVDDITVSISVEQSSIENTFATIKNSTLGYTPVWIYK